MDEWTYLTGPTPPSPGSRAREVYGGADLFEVGRGGYGEDVKENKNEGSVFHCRTRRKDFLDTRLSRDLGRQSRRVSSEVFWDGETPVSDVLHFR